jgi:hypothetical protein
VLLGKTAWSASLRNEECACTIRERGFAACLVILVKVASRRRSDRTGGLATVRAGAAGWPSAVFRFAVGTAFRGLWLRAIKASWPALCSLCRHHPPLLRFGLTCDTPLLKSWMTTKNVGTHSTARQVDAIMPENTVMPIDLRALAPAPVAATNGATPRMKANDVIRIGRKRERAAATADSSRGCP